MDKGLVYIITLVVTVLLQLAVAPSIQIGSALPDFLLIPVLFIALNSGPGAGGVAGFVLGLLYDFSGDGVIGAMAFTFCLIALVVGLVGTNMDSSPVVAGIAGIVFAFLSELIYGAVTVLGSSASSGAFSTVLSYAIPSALYTAVICLVALVTMSLVAADSSSQMGSKFGGAGFGGRGGFL